MTSTVPCRFYARGICRYGESCRFSHGQNQESFVGRVDHNLGRPHNLQQLSTNEKNKEFLTDSMLKDMEEWERGHIWPFSCYGPVAGKASIPFFDDLSVEEIRYQTLQNSGNPPPDVVDRLAQWNRTRLGLLQSRNTAKTLIEHVLSAPGSQSLQVPQTSPASNTFISQQQQQIYSPSTQVQSPSIFGGSASPSQIFGSTQSPNPNSYFTPGPPNAYSPPSPFSFSLGQTNQPQPQMQMPIMSTGTGGINPLPMQGAISPSNVQNFSFNQAMAQTQNSPSQTFGFSLSSQQMAPSVLSTPAPTGFQGFANPMVNPQQGSIPGIQPVVTATPSIAIFESSSTSFGGGVVQPQHQLQLGVANLKYAYSKLSDLTADEIKEYENDRFTSCESVPINPPTQEMVLY